MTSRRPQVRGAFLAQIREAAKERERLADVEAKLGPEALAAFRAPDTMAWVDEDACVEVLRIARPMVAIDDADWSALLRQQVRRGIQRFFKLFLRHMTPGVLFGSLPRMWSFTHTTGSLAVRAEAGRSVVVSYRDHPPLASPEYQELTVAVLEVLLDLNGTKGTVTARRAERPEELFVVDVRF